MSNENVITGEDRRALFELREKVELARSKLREVVLTSQYKQKFKKKSELTLAEITRLPAESNVYKGVGRMFMKRDLTSITSDLKSLIDKAAAEIASLEKQKDYLEKQLEKSTVELQEVTAGFMAGKSTLA